MMQVAIVGGTGLVGREMLSTLSERRVAVGRVRLFASPRSAGQRVDVAGDSIVVEQIDGADLGGIDVALFSAGADTALELAMQFVDAGAVVIDNSSAFRSDPQVPLVVPEVNGAAVTAHRGLIANPNCSTIQLVVALKPIADLVGLRRVQVATYQSVSGVGWKGVATLDQELRTELGVAGTAGDGAGVGDEVFAHPIAFEVLPHCGTFAEEGWTTEELKLMRETRRILGKPELAISATNVRVPVRRCHAEAVWVETRDPLEVEAARELFRQAPGVELVDEPAAARYPLTRRAAGTDQVLVGRLRSDPAVERGLLFWVVADNVRKGAALNAVQILEELAARRMLTGIKEPPRSGSSRDAGS
jgi:aspartate-semialdehyde dehydrogenase